MDITRKTMKSQDAKSVVPVEKQLTSLDDIGGRKRRPNLLNVVSNGRIQSVNPRQSKQQERSRSLSGVALELSKLKVEGKLLLLQFETVKEVTIFLDNFETGEQYRRYTQSPTYVENDDYFLMWKKAQDKMEVHDEKSFKESYARMNNKRMYSEQGNDFLDFVPLCFENEPIDGCDGYNHYLQTTLNKRMYSLYGNPETIVKVESRRSKKKKNRRKKKEVVVVESKRKLERREKRKLKRQQARELAKFNQVRRGGLTTLALHSGIKQTKSAARRVAEMFMLPGVSENFRFSDTYTSADTALASPFMRVDAEWNDTVDESGASGMAASEMAAFAFRDPERALIVYNANNADAIYGYFLYGYHVFDDATEETTNVPAKAWTTEVFCGQARPLNTPYGVFDPATWAWAPHGPIVYCGVSNANDNFRFFWCEANTAINMNAICASTDTDYELWMLVYRLNGSNCDYYEGDALPLSTDSQTWSVTVLKAGYYAVALGMQEAAEASVGGNIQEQIVEITQLGFSNNKDVWCHLALGGYSDLQASIDGIRINGASLMYTNTAAPIYRSGTVTGYQIPARENWYDYVQRLSELQSNKKAITIEAQNGMYGFLKSMAAEDFELRRNLKNDNMGNVIDCVYKIFPDSAPIVIYASISDVNGRAGYWTYTAAVEFPTESTWFDVSTERVGPRVFSEAQEMVRETPQFYTNAGHLSGILSKIGNGVKSITSGIMKYGPSIMKMAETAMPLFA